MENDAEAGYSDDSLEGRCKPVRSFGRCQDSPKPAFGRCQDSPKRTFARCHSPKRAFGMCQDSPKLAFGTCQDSAKPAFVRCQDSPNPAFGTCHDSPKLAFGPCQKSAKPAFVRCQDSPKPAFGMCHEPPKLAFGVSQDCSKAVSPRKEDARTLAYSQHQNCPTTAFGLREDSPNLGFGRCEASGTIQAFGRCPEVPVFYQPTSIRLPPKVCLDATTTKKRNYLVNKSKQPKTYLQKFRESISKTGIHAPPKACPVEVNSVSVECGDTERESLTEDLEVTTRERDFFETEAYNDMVYEEILRGDECCSCPGRVSDRSLPMFSGETVVAAVPGASSVRSQVSRSKSEVHRRRVRTPGPPPQPPGPLGGLGPDLAKTKPYVCTCQVPVNQDRLKFVRQYSERVRIANKNRLSKKDKKSKEEELPAKTPAKIQIKDPILARPPSSDPSNTKDKQEVKKSLLKSIYKVPTEKYFSNLKSEYNLQEDLDKDTFVYKSNNTSSKPVYQGDDSIDVKYSSKNIETDKTHFNLTDRGTQAKVLANSGAQFEERFILQELNEALKAETNVTNKEVVSTSVGESLTKLLNRFDVDIEETGNSRKPNTYYVLEKRERRECSNGNKFISRQESRETIFRGSNINSNATSQVQVMHLETSSDNQNPFKHKVDSKEARTPSIEVIKETRGKGCTDFKEGVIKETRGKGCTDFKEGVIKDKHSIKEKKHRCDFNVRCGKKCSPKISIVQSASNPMNVRFSVNLDGIRPSTALKKMEEKHRAYKEALKDLMQDSSLSASVYSKKES